MQKDMKVINILVNKDLHKKIAKIAIDKEVSVKDVCIELLERSVKNKKFDEVEEV